MSKFIHCDESTELWNTGLENILHLDSIYSGSVGIPSVYRFNVIHGVEDIFNSHKFVSWNTMLTFHDCNVNHLIIFRSFSAEFVRFFLECLPVFLPILRSIIWECLHNYYLEAGPLSYGKSRRYYNALYYRFFFTYKWCSTSNLS